MEDFSLEDLLKEIAKDEQECKEYEEYVKRRRQRRNRKKDKEERRKNIQIALLTLGTVALSLSALISLCNRYPLSQYQSKNYFKQEKLIAKEEVVDSLMQQLEEGTGLDIDYEDSSNLLLYAIYQNENLTESEKELLYQFSDLICSNPYLNKEEAYESLENVAFCYVDRPEGKDTSVLGEYNYKENKIYIYSYQKDVVTHEGIHCIYFNNSTKYLPNWFCEGMTQLLNNDFFDLAKVEEIDYYVFEVAMTKMLCEIVGEDIVLKSFSKGSMYDIKTELDKKLSPKNRGNDFLEKTTTLFLKCEYGLPICPDDSEKILEYLGDYVENSKDNTDQDKLKRIQKYYNMLSCLATEKPFRNYCSYLLSLDLEDYESYVYFKKTDAKTYSYQN